MHFLKPEKEQTSMKRANLTYRDLTPEELAAIRAFAKAYGREWKEYLFAAWLSYTYKGLPMGGKDTGILRCIRNDLGNAWLHQFRLPKDIT
jgi:hypothetical protein